MLTGDESRNTLHQSAKTSGMKEEKEPKSAVSGAQTPCLTLLSVNMSQPVKYSGCFFALSAKKKVNSHEGMMCFTISVVVFARLGLLRHRGIFPYTLPSVPKC